jgi:hypothetical protein
MLAIMFDPCFKFLQLVKNYLEHEDCIHLAFEYDANAVIPLLMTIFEVLNPTI